MPALPKASDFVLPRWDASRFDVDPDNDLLERLTDDMNRRGGALRPAHWWMLAPEDERGTMERMLSPWCGDVGQLPLADPELIIATSGSTELIPSTLEFARAIDHLGLLEEVDGTDLGSFNWRVCDLFSLIDLFLISAFCELPVRGARILEVGGGFGRLAEFLSLAGYRELRYVNIDAVPVSLMYCYCYLRARFPEKTVSIFFPEDVLPDDPDFLIVPAWHADSIGGRYDMAVNIESFQEMSQELVDYYIGLFDGATRSGGYIYMTNSREYKFRGEWNFPVTWECRFRHRTTRAWTADHPTEIFCKEDGVFVGIDGIRQYFFDREVQARRGR